MQYHPGNIHQSFATPRYSATPCYVLIQVPYIINMISKRRRNKIDFFFPSCASVALARSSHIVVLMNELFRCIFHVPPWGVESGVRTITQSEVLSGPKNKKHKNEAKQQKQNPQNPAKEAQTRTAPMGLATYVPMNYESLHGSKKPTPDHTARSCEGVSKINSAAPKPRIPPARIPEIALRSPPGMRHLRNEGQLCNELERYTSVGTLPCEAPRQIYW